jgi:hypothetical protein
MVAQAGIPRMNLELTWMVARFWIAEKPAGVVWMAAGIAGSPNGVEDLIWPFPWHSDTLLPSVALEPVTIERLMLALVVAAVAVPQ